jgi:hypothetical protein
MPAPLPDQHHAELYGDLRRVGNAAAVLRTLLRLCRRGYGVTRLGELGSQRQDRLM